jgi:hypothetical protein
MALFWCLSAVDGCKKSPKEPTGPQPQKLPEVDITIGDVNITVEVADEEAERHLGLMHRDSIPDGRGMIFIFPSEDNLSFYMRSTRVDLDLAYARADGTIFQIERMTAYDLRSVTSREPAKYALEVPAGFLSRSGIRAGDKLMIPPEISQAP